MAIRLADLFGAGQEGRQAARDDQTRKGLAAYMQGDQGAIGQVYANDPDAALRAETAVDGRRAAAEDRLGKLSTAFAQSKDPAIYAQWRQAAQGVMGPQAAAMPEYLDDPADMDGAVKTATAWAQAYGQGIKQPEDFTLAPGSARYKADGTPVVSQPFSPANAQIVNVPDGQGGFVQMEYDPRERRFSQPNYGGSTSSPIGQPDVQDQYAQLGDQFGFQTTSTTRTPAQNEAANGVPNSQHLTGTARDFSIRGKTPEQVQAFEESLRGRGFEVLRHNAGSGMHVHAELPPNRTGAPQGRRLGYTPPKQDAEAYTLMSPEEIQAIGLPVGTVAQRNPKGGIQIINKPRDLPTGGQVIDNGDGTTTYIPAGKISEGERNAAGFYERMVKANAEMKRLDDAGYDPANRRDYYTAGGEYANPLASSEGQQYRQAQNNWLRANLRKESGAAIGVEEMDQERKNYFPIPGDTKETRDQKARNRETTERAMRQAAGGALAPPAQKSKESEPSGSTGGWSIKVKP